MWNQRENGEMRGGRERVIALAVARDKGSQSALKWALEHVVPREHSLKLVHVRQRSPSSIPLPGQNNGSLNEQLPDDFHMDLFLPFRCFCLRRLVQSEVAVLEDPDIARGLTDYARCNGVDTLLLGAGSRSGLSRLFKTSEIASNVLKWAPDFCNVYVISKGKINAVRPASRPVPNILTAAQGAPFVQHNLNGEESSAMSFSRTNRMYDELSPCDADVSFAGSGRLSTDSAFLSFYENLSSGLSLDSSRHSNFEDISSGIFADTFNPLQELHTGTDDIDSVHESASIPHDNGIAYRLSKKVEVMEDEIKRLKTELKHTMDMYHAACKEALTAKQKAMEIQQWKVKEEKRIQEAHLAEESALMIVEKEKEKYKGVLEVAEAAKRLAKQEEQKRMEAEMKALKEAEEKKMVLDALGSSHVVVKYQSLYHILVVLILFYFYFLVL